MAKSKAKSKKNYKDINLYRFIFAGLGLVAMLLLLAGMFRLKFQIFGITTIIKWDFFEAIGGREVVSGFSGEGSAVVLITLIAPVAMILVNLINKKYVGFINILIAVIGIVILMIIPGIWYKSASTTDTSVPDGFFLGIGGWLSFGALCLSAICGIYTALVKKI